MHDPEDFVTSGTIVALSNSAFTDLFTNSGDAGSYKLIYTMTVDTISDS